MKFGYPSLDDNLPVHHHANYKTPSSPKLCSEQGCDRVVRAKGHCAAHGGGRRCSQDGCSAYARRGGVCHRHRFVATPAADNADPIQPSQEVKVVSIEEGVSCDFDLDVLRAVFGSTIIVDIENLAAEHVECRSL
ncbi:Aste57867_1798 [Aphanomyces stellatus]|uniref:Aste57867_1798 protein n=1 Tax=Aphanomyces stellatus TaxID=120398 RepID=A0A485K7A1_9STRA|nr:hypothetical protein As57867_001796 [Aphanomyces stellatus]VFT79007.1 Aste57867_1798 [Aphanomyces stellatus]